MKKLPILDLLTLALVIGIGFDLYRTHDRIARLEQISLGSGDALQEAKLLPMDAVALSGRKITLGTGAPRLIFYMSPDCGACGRNMPAWSAVAQKVGQEHTLFLLSDEKALPKMPAYLGKYNLASFPSVAADPMVVNRYYMISYPRTLLVDAHGKVAKVWRGAISENDLIAAWKAVSNS
jgi:hypothetical protein